MVAMAQSAPSAERLRKVDEFLAEAWADLARNDEPAAPAGGGGPLRPGGRAPDRRGRRPGSSCGWSASWSAGWPACSASGGRVRVGGRAPVVVDLGCGATKQWPGNLGLDIYPAPGVNAVADLSGSLPLADDSVDVFFAVHILEHLIDFLPLLDECHRVLRPGGVLHVMSPWWRHVNAVADPTHVRLLDVQTFKGICGQRPPGTPRWYPLHAGCDGASIFADLTPLRRGRPTRRAEPTWPASSTDRPGPRAPPAVRRR